MLPSNTRLYLYNITYCPILNLFGREQHCELCCECIILTPKKCVPIELHTDGIEDDGQGHWRYKLCCWFPLHGTLKEPDCIYYTLDGDRWIQYRTNESYSDPNDCLAQVRIFAST